MTLHSEATYYNGVLHLLEPMPLSPHQRVRITIEVVEESSVPVQGRDGLQKLLEDSATFRIGALPTREEMNAR